MSALLTEEHDRQDKPVAYFKKGRGKTIAQ